MFKLNALRSQFIRLMCGLVCMPIPHGMLCECANKAVMVGETCCCRKSDTTTAGCCFGNANGNSLGTTCAINCKCPCIHSLVTLNVIKPTAPKVLLDLSFTFLGWFEPVVRSSLHLDPRNVQPPIEHNAHQALLCVWLN